MGKEVPIVLYKSDGERIVVGSATVEGDTMVGIIIPSLAAELGLADTGAYSISPEPAVELVERGEEILKEINTCNDFLIGSDGQTLAPMRPPFMTTREQAYRTAAWIKTMAVILPPESEEHTFEEIEEAIRNS